VGAVPTSLRSRPRIVIAGGGVAAVEALLALRHLLGQQVSIELLAPEPEFVHRPSSVAVPFGFGAPAPLDLHALAARFGATVRRAALAGVDSQRRVALVGGPDEVPYDILVVAVGAVARATLPGAVVFGGPADAPALEALLSSVKRGEVRRIVFALPSLATWPLPVYELAIMTAAELGGRGLTGTELTVVTPEREPLWLFGPAAGAAVRELLRARGIQLRTSARPVTVGEGVLGLDSGEKLDADAVVALPELEGPRLPGLPSDESGFLEVDANGRVTGVADVYAAGDATAFPIKQGGLAAQQADAVAEAIAARLGRLPHAAPFQPVLRGLLLTGGAPLYLRAELSPGGALREHHTGAGAGLSLRGQASGRALWWPPGKVAGRYLAPYLATARPLALAAEALEDRAPSAGAQAADREDALELALLLADEDAKLGDYRQALHALDAAAALGGGVLPSAWAERRSRWQHELAPIP